jgi:ABC-type multidrug transport system ATPase subunit
MSTRLKLSLDNAIAAYYSQLKLNPGVEPDVDHLINAPVMTMKYQGFPKTYPRFFAGYDEISGFGAFYFFIPYMISFIVTITEITREKEKRLRQGLSVMGMTASTYWISWAITTSIICGMVTLSSIFSAYACGFEMFTRTPFPILFTTLFLFGMSMQAVAFFISTLCSTMKMGYSVGYAFLLLAIVIEFFIGDIIGVYVFYLTSAPKWFRVIRSMLTLYPAWNFSKVFGEIAAGSGRHYDLVENRWILGPGFTYADLYKEIKGKFPGGMGYEAPTTGHSLAMLGVCVVFYMTLTWYCDHIVSHNRGSSDSPLFFFERKYWDCCSRRSKGKRKHSADERNLVYSKIQNSDTAKGETAKVIQHNEENIECKGLRISKLNKIYRKYPFGIKSQADLHAVNDIYLEVDDCELLSILGHNGAGKTTLIGVLTGILEPTSGKAEMFDLDITEDMDNIRQIMGVCPQHDILWDELTAEEHLIMFSKLKQIPEDRIDQEVETKLKQVNLFDVKNAWSGTFSGGMKRRLSMAICAVGDPKIIFLDEPTTGMDPNSRRQVWELIKQLKKGRIVILTTHAMEEADVLSDRIAIMVDGNLKCIGTQLSLKNQYGEGYRLNLVADKDDVSYVSAKIQQIVPSAKIFDESGGSILVTVPLDSLKELKNFFKIMESKYIDDDVVEFKNKIKDWGLSHSTLEEVFMKVTNKRLQHHGKQ